MKQILPLLSVLILCTIILGKVASAQKDSTKLNQSVEVMKAYRPSIANANKINLLPVIEDTTRFSPEFVYSIDSRPINSGFTASSIKPADVNKRYYQESGIGYLKLGAGTSNSVFGEFFINLPESRAATFGLHLRHLSSDGQIKLREANLVDAPCSQNNAAIFGSVNIGSTILSTDLSYDRDAMRYYGYPGSIPAKIDSLSAHKYGLKQVYERGALKVALRSSDQLKHDLTFNSGIRLGFFDSKTGQKENSAGLFGKFDYNFGPVHGLVNASYDHFTTDSVTLNPTTPNVGSSGKDWIRIAPSLMIGGDNWELRGGLNFVTVTNKNGGNITKLYPDFELNYNPVPILALYASFKGDLKNNNYENIAIENPWSDPHHNLQPTDFNYTLSGGLKGKMSREISYNIGVNHSKINDLYFYVLNSYLNAGSAPLYYSNQFGVEYGNATVTDFSAEFSYVSGKDLSIILKGNYYNYSLEKLSVASHKPNFDLSATLGLRIIDNLTGYADLGVIGSRQARVININPFASPVSHDEVIQIDPSIQLNLGATYELTSKFRLFGRVDNVLNRLNEQWLGYASQGLRLIAGVSVSF